MMQRIVAANGTGWKQPTPSIDERSDGERSGVYYLCIAASKAATLKSQPAEDCRADQYCEACFAFFDPC